MGSPIIWAGTTAKSLKSIIDMNGNAQILSGTVDPTAVATSAPIGSIYMNSSTGGLYRKTDAGSSTNWATIGNTAIITSWTAYTPTLTGFGTTSGVSFLYRQVGNCYEIRGTWTTGTVAATLASITLPNSGTLDTTQLSLANTTAAPGPQVGTWTQNGANNNAGPLVTATTTSTSLIYFGSGYAVSNAMLTPQNGNGVMNSALLSSVHFLVPISGLVGVSAAPTQQTVYFKDVKANQTDGGTFTSGSYQTRVLNTFENPQSVSWTSAPSSNQFTLSAGTYRIFATATAQAVNRHKAKLRNITDSTDDIIGTSSMNDTTANQKGTSDVRGIITITGSKTYEIQHRCQTTGTTTGYGSASNWTGETEVYTIVEITKLL